MRLDVVDIRPRVRGARWVLRHVSLPMDDGTFTRWPSPATLHGAGRIPRIWAAGPVFLD